MHVVHPPGVFIHADVHRVLPLLLCPSGKATMSGEVTEGGGGGGCGEGVRLAAVIAASSKT